VKPDLESVDPWQVLGVPAHSPEKQVRKAYKRLTRQFPPDRAPDQFAKVHTALQKALGVVPPPWLPPPLATPGDDGMYARFVQALDKGDYPQLYREIETNLGSAIESGANAAALLRGAAVMAWRTPAAEQIIGGLTPIARRLGERAVADAAEQETRIALGFYRLGGVAGLGETPLFALFGDHLLASPARRRATAAEIGRVLDADWRPLMMICDRIAMLDPPLGRVLAARLQRESPLWGDRALAPLTEEVKAELARRLIAIHDSGRALRVLGGLAISIGGVALAVAAHAPILGEFGVFGGVAVGVGRADQRYSSRIRPPVIALLGELGLQADTVTAWVRANPGKNGALQRYTINLTWDVALELFGAISALVREYARQPVSEQHIYR